MSKSPEGGYVPSPEEEQKDEAIMNAEEKKASEERDARIRSALEKSVNKSPETNKEPSGEVLEFRKHAEKTILETMELDPELGLDNFQEKLSDAIKSLPRYQEIENNLAEVQNDKLVYELFKAIRKSADGPPVNNNESQNLPVDGVLIRLMRKGSLECAGRTAIASTLLRERGLEHSVASGIGHSFIIVEVDPKTLAYFDANDELYFTFPKTALGGYKGAKKSAICKIEEYTPGDKDVVDGIGAVQDVFTATPPAEGVARQYLNNVAVALGGG